LPQQAPRGDLFSLLKKDEHLLAGFTSVASSEPGVEMAGFANNKYRLTVSRLIPSSRAIRRRDQPRASKVQIVS